MASYRLACDVRVWRRGNAVTLARIFRALAPFTSVCTAANFSASGSPYPLEKGGTAIDSLFCKSRLCTDCFTRNWTPVMKSSRVYSVPSLTLNSSRELAWLTSVLSKVLSTKGLNALLSVMPKGPHLLRILLLEVWNKSFHHLPLARIDLVQVLHHLV